MVENQHDSYWSRKDPLRQPPPRIDRTAAFKEAKQRILNITDPTKRFAPKSDLIKKKEPEVKGEVSTGSSSSLEFQRKGYHGLTADRMMPQLPPIWVDTSEEFDEILMKINEQLDSLMSIKAQRFKPKFDNAEDDSLDIQITQLRGQIYDNLKMCESKLKQAKYQMLSSAEINDSNREDHERICENIIQAYLLRLKDATKKLRQIERDHIDKISKLYGVQGEIFLPMNELDGDGGMERGSISEQIQEEIQVDAREQKIKKQQIDNIVKQMNDLAELFTDLSNLVVEQGTVLDRIDFNLQDSRHNIKKGNRELQKIIDADNNPRVKAVQCCLIWWILVFACMFILKHSA